MTDRPKLLVTRRFPDAVEARAARDYDATVNPEDHLHSSDQLIEAAAGHDAILCSSTNMFDADVFERLPDSVRVIATFSVGIEHFDIEAAKARGIVLANTPGVMAEATADIAMLLLLAASRRAFEGDSMVRTGAWEGWTPTQLLGVGLQGKRLGILGMGAIGRAVAARARPFGLDIHYHNRSRLAADMEAGATYHEDAEDLLGVSDLLTIHCPMTPQTKGLLDAERIGLMPDGAVVVNTARGGIVDDEALIAALRSNRLAAAGLDGYDGEPNRHSGYRELANVFLLPHLGSATHETRDAMGFLALDNIDAFFAGLEPPNRVA